MSSGQKAITFLTGLGVGMGLALLFAPQSGAETREWIEDTADGGIKQLRRTAKRTLRNLQAAASKSEDTVSNAIKSGKDTLGTLSARLD